MSIQRSIVQRLFESRGLYESEFKSGGSTYKCVFGRYYKDDEEIDRDEYFKAKDQITNSSQSKDIPKEKKWDDDFSPEEIDSEMDDIESKIDDLRDTLKSTSYDDRDDIMDKIESMGDLLSRMEGAMSDEQYERSNKLQSTLWKLEDTEYEESEPDWDMMSGGHDDY